MKKFIDFRIQKGQSLVELLITIALASLLLPSLLTSLFATRSGRAQQNQRVEAINLLKEAQETTRLAREKDWATFAVNGPFHPVISGSTWELLPDEEVINGFTRQIIISDTYRDSSGKIVVSGGWLDLSTKKVTVKVSWNTPFSSTIEATNYLTRFNNQTYMETTEADFNAGTKTGVSVTNTEGGEIMLGTGGRGNWCDPNLSISAVDLPKQGVANAITAIEGQVFAGTGDNASGVSFANVGISNPPYPTTPAGNIDGTFDGYKTNDVFGEENYAYLATDNNFKEIVIIDLTQKDINGKYQEIGYFDAPGNGAGDSVFVSGNTGFMTDEDKLYTFDLSSKSGSRPQLGNVSLAGTGKKIVVSGNYAYVAVDSSTQMQIINSSDPSNPSVVGQASVVGEEGESIAVNSTATRAYLATDSSSSKKEFFIIDISTKTGDRPTLGSYDTNGMDPKGVVILTGNKAIVVGKEGEEYQVVDIRTESNPLRCGGINIDTGVNGISAVIEADGDAYAYIITGDATLELKIIEGGPGGQYSSSGTFESQTFDAGKDSTFNKFSVTADKLPQTDIKFQVAVAHAVSDSCSSPAFVFVGPDGTSGTFFSTSSMIPLNAGPGFENPGRCMRYKAFLSSLDTSQSPILYSITFNYSP